MVTQCPECLTRYRLEEYQLPASGKVRCARCRHVFLAESVSAPAEPPIAHQQEPELEPRPAPMPDPATELAAEPVAAAASATSPADAGDPFADIFAAGDEPDESPAPLTAPPVDEGFDFDQFEEQLATEPEEDGYADGFVTELDETDETEDPFHDALDEGLTDRGPAAGMLPEDDLLDEIEEEEDAAPTFHAPPAKRPRSPMSLVTLIILAVLLALLGFIGYLMWADGVDAPLRLLQQLLG